MEEDQNIKNNIDLENINKKRNNKYIRFTQFCSILDSVSMGNIASFKVKNKVWSKFWSLSILLTTLMKLSVLKSRRRIRNKKKKILIYLKYFYFYNHL